MDGWDIAYQLILLMAFIVSLNVFKTSGSKYTVFPILLGITNLVELTIFFTKQSNPGYPIYYHFFIPVEYSLLAYFYTLHVSNELIRKIIFFSIPVIIFCCFAISFSTSFYKFPTFQFNIAGVSLVILALFSLFSLEIEFNKSIFTHPLFLINVGILVFYSGNLFLMGLYNSLRENNLDLARLLFRSINTTLNFIMYSLFIIAFICLSTRRSLTPLS